MSGESSMFSESLETFLYGGPSIPTGYQSLSDTFSGASPFPRKPMSSSCLNESNTGTLNNEQVYMMSGNISNPTSQGSSIQPRGNLKTTIYGLGCNPKDNTYLKVNPKDNTYQKVNINLRDNTYLKVNINPKVSTYLKVNIKLKVSIMLKDCNLLKGNNSK